MHIIELTRRMWVRFVSRRAANRDSGAGLVEYALLMALIVVVCVGALTFFGEETSSKLVIEAECWDGACQGP